MILYVALVHLYNDLTVSRRTLASAGALTFSLEHDIATVAPEELITQQALRNWERWRSRLPPEDLPAPSLDTVGAVALDSSGSLATGVSRSVPSTSIRSVMQLT